MVRCLTLASLLVAITSACAQHTLDGQPVSNLGARGARAVVLFFVASDCPISNRTFPEMKRLREQFTPGGIRFWFVYPNTDETPGAVRTHQSSFDSQGEVLLDPEGTLSRLARATTTPEVAILIPNVSSWKPVYTGRIDDRFVRFGLERPQATQHFAERVLREVLEGKPIDRPRGNPVGCGIVTGAAR